MRFLRIRPPRNAGSVPGVPHSGVITEGTDESNVLRTFSASAYVFCIRAFSAFRGEIPRGVWGNHRATPARNNWTVVAWPSAAQSA
jgi:hypothetical protein